MLREHLERKRVRPRPAISGHPVWVKTSILEKYCPTSQDDDDMSVSTTGSNRRFNSPRTNKTPRQEGWGWILGYATDEVTDDPHGGSPPPIEHRSTARPYRHSAEQGNLKEIKTSPFGHVKLRKTNGSGTVNMKPIPSSPRMGRSIIVQAKTITIHDEWNRKYNGSIVKLNGDEVAKNVLQANSFDGELRSPPKNLIELTHLHEPSIIQSLKHRYDEGKVYTFCGRILLALNPFCEIKGLYGDEVMKAYWGHQDYHEGSLRDSTEPHVYAIANETFRSMQRAFDDVDSSKRGTNGKVVDQSILVSGESGAGKTFNTKIIMRYLAKLSQQSAGGKSKENSGGIEQQVLQSNPILESFGNARTIRNDNSSRFGKFVEIQFHRTGRLIGASVKTYLLEKVRLIRQAEGERNYHIFYELLSGLSSFGRERKELRLNGSNLNDFRITSSSGTFDRRDGVQDTETYTDLRKAMNTVGFSKLEQMEILQVTSGLLHLSNLTFDETQVDGITLDSTNLSLEHILFLFGVDNQALSNALCQCTIKVGNETLHKNLSLDKGEKALEALMKATYGALFEYIVKKVNSSIRVEKGDHLNISDTSVSREDYAFIKILDIFGFESFETNSFEQLCINYCNEALQQQFNKFIFKLEQQEYEKENIAWSFISFPDNQDVLDLIEKKHCGIFSILDEQCKLARCTDQSFANATYEKCGEHSRFNANRTQKARGLFSVHHYAGPVEYAAAFFLDKNKDELPKEATEFLMSSSISIVPELGRILSKKTGSSRAAITNKTKRSSSSLTRASVGNQFATQLHELRQKIDLTEPHYVRCLKPNEELTCNNFSPTVIADQLRCAGVLEAVRVSRVGYPQRYEKDLFVERYWILGSKCNRTTKGCVRRSSCESLINHIVPDLWEKQQQECDTDANESMKKRGTYDLVAVGIQLGKTKVFLRQGAFDALEYLRGEKLNLSATKIQSAFRMFVEQTEYRYALYSIFKIQSTYRLYRCRKIRQIKRAAKMAVLIQKSWRKYKLQSSYCQTMFLAKWIQRTHRGRIARRKVTYIRSEKKALILQNWWRMALFRKHFIIKRRLAFNLQQLLRAKIARRTLRLLRVEARDVSRLEKERNELRCAAEEMKRHLEDVKRVAEENAKKIAYDARIQAQNEARKALDLAKRNEQERETEDINKLAQEALEKDRHIEELKQEILKLRAQVNSSGSIARSNSSELQCKPRNQQTFTPSRKQSVNTRCLISTSLLDGDDHMNSLNCTTTTLNDSWSADFSNSFQFETPIHTAIRAADDDALSEAVTNCGDVPSDINRGGRDGRTPLHLAVLGCNLPSVQFLLDNDSVPNAQDNSGNTALHYAKVNQMVKLLLEEGGANPNIPNSRGFCAIHLAVQRMDVKSVDYLIAHNAHVNVADDTNWQTPLHLVSQAQTPFESSEAPIKIASILCQATNKEKVDINYQDIHGNTPMHVSAVLKGENVCDIILLYLEHGGDPNIQNHRGQTPLHLVLHNAELREGDHYYEMIRLMLHHGGDPNIPSLSGCTPLHLSFYHQDIRSTLLLTEKGAQLHLPWEKPNRWHTHWVNTSHDGIVFCFEMIDNIEILRKIISVISCKQKDAPRRQNCMQCKRKFGKFGRQHNCGFCGSLVCSQCAPTTLDGAYFPRCFDGDILQENTRVCILCEQILITRKQENDLMGKEVYAIHGDEDVSFLGNDTSFQGQEEDEAIVQFSSLDVEM